ncbi:LysR family transcriptional regulator [Roseovarius sp.]|uniref:LysR family transcriptional regulator n=1 Tax=Roseovarius sp. TaxID=1486281 RepID=UPI003A9696AF
MIGLRRKLPSANALFVFEAAARHENFTRAAEELNVTQPAVSRTLAGLESHLGAQLFLRGKPGARLTDDGILLKTAVESAFSQINSVLDQLEERRTGKAQVTLSVSTAFTTHWLMPRIAQFQKVFPSVDLRFQLIAGQVTGPTGGVDIAMRYGSASETSGRFVMREAYVPVCAPGYLNPPPPDGPALIRLDGEASEGVASLMPGLGLRRDGQLGFSDYAVVVQAALVGQGIAAGWMNIVSYWMNEERLVPAVNELVFPGRECRMLARTDGAHADVVEAVRDWLVDEIQSDLRGIAIRYPALGVDALLTSGGQT